ncbi:radiation-inducible immediate-early gene IEX-1 [Paramisgurnus dabryanus]|uniref:radiation-inducible immediate-early gene IEX-1 n=1 Tax=Paramisgurnus dabryanus TaxID=90735 RepID=UPI0031F3DAFC
MFARSDSLLLSIPTSNFFQQQPHFDFRPMRSTEPEIFTFERIPETQQSFPHRGAPVRPRKRNTRVMYPAQVRKYLPPVEKSRAKRWLFILCLVVFMQIYTEEGSVESTQAEGPAATTYNALSFQSAEEQARQMMSMSDQKLQVGNEEKESLNQFLNTSCQSATCEDDVTALYQQSRRSGYVVALLYPVYHRLGTEK